MLLITQLSRGIRVSCHQYSMPLLIGRSAASVTTMLFTPLASLNQSFLYVPVLALMH